MPAHRVHFKHGYALLRELGLDPIGSRVRSVDRLIDFPRQYAREYLKAMETREEVRGCIEEKFDDPEIIYFLPAFSHDMRTQRYSPKRTDWSRTMISVLRRLIDCVHGEGYGLLADLHALLDMAEKWCCDDRLLEEWARDVGLDPRVLEYYTRHREAIDRDLGCTERKRQGRCGLRNAARALREQAREGGEDEP
ncbi:MAG: hypothetical protein GSR80_000838 [Desulfurococcales archaeon]|nr:hypothetical protein [Desulfurococcales archaeon]